MPAAENSVPSPSAGARLPHPQPEPARKLAEELEPRLVEVWPRDSKFERRSYELLRAAYVKARYSRHHRITAEELEWLGARIDRLQGLIRDLCEERIEALAAAA